MKQNNLLYSENEAFLAHKVDTPINYDEIMANFRSKYGAIEMRALFRIPLAIGLLLFAFALLYGCLTFIKVVLEAANTMGILYNILNIVFIFGAILMVYVFFNSSYRLLLPKTKKVAATWLTLKEKGSITSGQVIDYEIISLAQLRIKYQFKAKDGIEGEGIYNVAGLFSLRSKTVIVWYVDKEIHTLL